MIALLVAAQIVAKAPPRCLSATEASAVAEVVRGHREMAAYNRDRAQENMSKAAALRSAHLDASWEARLAPSYLQDERKEKAAAEAVERALQVAPKCGARP